MPRFTVCYSVVGSGAVEVKAESPEEAIQAAYSEAHVSVCHHCARHISDPEMEEVTAVIDEAGDEVWTKEVPLA